MYQRAIIVSHQRISFVRLVSRMTDRNVNSQDQKPYSVRFWIPGTSSIQLGYRRNFLDLSSPPFSEICFYINGNAISFLLQIIFCHCVTELLWPLILRLVQFLKSNQELFEYYTYDRLIKILGHTVSWKTNFASKDLRFYCSASKCPVFWYIFFS
jgi:hypothetical protein